MFPVCRLARSDFLRICMINLFESEVTSCRTVKIWVAYFIKYKIQ